MTALTEKQNREQALANLQSQPGEDTLWQCIIAFQQYEFKTYSGLSFPISLNWGKTAIIQKNFLLTAEKTVRVCPGAQSGWLLRKWQR